MRNIIASQGLGKLIMALNLSEQAKVKFPFIGGSYLARSKTQDCSRTVNMYPELHGYGAGKNLSPAALYSRYGLQLLQTLAPGPIRGGYTISNTQISFIVSGNALWQIASGSGIATQISGNLTTSSGFVSMTDNGQTLLLVDGSNGYTVSFGGIDAITAVNTVVGGSGYIDGTYKDVALTGGTGALAIATLIVSAGSVTTVTVTQGGYDYTVGDVLSVSPSFDGAGLGTGFSVTVASVSAVPLLNKIVDANFYDGATTCTYQGGYFICNQAGTNVFFFSTADSATWPALNIGSVDAYSDVLLAVLSNNQELYMLCSKTIQIWSANSNATASAPFSPISGRSVNIGLTAPGTVQRIAGTFLFLGASEQGSGIVYSMENDSPVRKSNSAIEFRLQQAGDLSTSTALTWQENGHQFYALNCPNIDTTFVYDLTTDQWVEYQSRDSSGTNNRWWAQTHCYLAGQHIFGDYVNGNIYTMVDGYWLDNATPMSRIRQCPHQADGVQMQFYKTLQVDVQPGAGTLTQDPRYVLEISRDGGWTWGNAIYAKAGKIGQYLSRVRWQRLGRARDTVFRVTCDDPVNVVMLDAYLDVEQGTS